jgi:acetyl-CoA C-acetyltransferase
MIKPVYILSAKRTPLGSFMGSLSTVPAPKLGAKAIMSALQEAKVNANDVTQVYMGCVLSAGVGQAPARQAAIFANLPKSAASTTVNKVCGSGMQAVILGAQAIQTNDADLVVSGGMENMSMVPFYLQNLRNGYRMGHQKIIDGMIHDGLWDVYNNFHMGNAAELCVKEFQFTREEQDEFAKESFLRAQKAIEQGKFKKEIIAVEVEGKKGESTLVDTDEGPFKANFEKMGKLSPAFDKNGTITAANASTINDGAAALVLASEEYVKKNNLKPLAKIVSYASHAQDPAWFTTAPVEAMKKALNKASWNVSQVDLFEVNEAFAVVAMAAQKSLEIPHDKLNVFGGAVSLGHPIGASGARILVTLISALQDKAKKKGMASICIGGGEALAMAIELV